MTYDPLYFAMRQATRLPWSAMVKSFCEKLDTKESKPVLGEVRASARSVTDGRNVTLSGTLDAENADLSWFVVTKAGTGDREVVSSVSVDPDDDGALEWEWDGAVPVLEASRGQTMVVTRAEAVVEEDADDQGDEKNQGAADKKDDDNETDAPIAAQVWIKRGKSDWRLGWLLFDADPKDEERMQLVDAIVIEPASGSERPWKVKKGDRLKPVRLTLSGNGKLAEDLKKPPEGPEIVVASPKLLNLRWNLLDPGKYQAGFMSQNSAGETEHQTIDVEVK